MINSVRNTVLFLLNKDNRGYITPSEFDFFAKQAQLEIFEGYFSDYSSAVLAQNTRKKSLGYGDSVAQIQNKIDIFTARQTLNYTIVGTAADSDDDYFTLPSNFYKLINITYNNKVLQQLQGHKFDMIVNSNLTPPSLTYPIYKREGLNIFARPTSISYTDATPQGTEIPLVMNYIRKPVDPHWGYTTVDSDPVYNSSTSTQFEIPASDEAELVYKICTLAGLSIRDVDIAKAAKDLESQQFQKESR